MQLLDLLCKREKSKAHRDSSMYLQAFVGLIFGTVFGFIFTQFGGHPLSYIGLSNRNLSQRCVHGYAQQQARNKRPRLLRTEAKSQELLFIGVMTARKYLDTRAIAVNNTWATEVQPGHLQFFISEGNETTSKGYNTSHVADKLPIISLQGIRDNEYPPQKKVMAMLRHMHDHYLDKFHWFMRADDDVYIRPGKLRAFLSHLDKAGDVVVGQGGVGKSDEVDKLGLIKSECYCLGGPGVIMSRNVLRKITPNIEHCLQETASTHEDVELGRCIRKFAGVSCLWAREAIELFKQVYKNQENAYHGPLNTPEINRALSLHPVKDPAYMYRLHVHFLLLRARNLHHVTSVNEVILQQTKSRAVEGARRNVIIHARNTSSHLVTWSTLTDGKYHTLSYMIYGRIPGHVFSALKNAVREVVFDINYENNHKLGKNEAVYLTKMHQVYIRVNPLRGAEFSIDVSTKIKQTKLLIPWKPKESVFHRRGLQKRFLEIQGEVVTHSWNLYETVHFIVPLKGKLDAFKMFLENVRRAFLIPGEKIALLVMYFPETSTSKNHKNIYEKYKSEFPETSFLWVDIPGAFNRAKALQRGVELLGNDSLLFFSDVDLVFTKQFVYRCRSNTIKSQQAYFPIMFSQYNRNISYFSTIKPRTDFTYTKTAGVWRRYSFGPVCIYSDDVIAVGGLSQTIEGWGLEDVDFFMKVFNSGLGYFRVQDPGIVHIYHIHVSCSSTATKKQKEMCFQSLRSTLAARSGLVNYLMSKRYIRW